MAKQRCKRCDGPIINTREAFASDSLRSADGHCLLGSGWEVCISEMNANDAEADGDAYHAVTEEWVGSFYRLN
ncbi:MAG: hypothetical protein M3R04_10460 [bacterium]|nr:hypothetical protein [bacterium]